MKNSHALFFIGLAVIIMFLSLDLTKRGQTRAIIRDIQATVVTKAPVKAAPVIMDTTPKVPFIDKFKKEAAQIAKIQTNPDEADARIQRLASQMRPQDVDSMYEVISNDKINGDQRALAVELLTVKNDTTSLMALQNFVANNKNINGKEWDRKKEFETVLRAQAVEGISAYPQKDIALSTLTYLQHKVDNTFLAERIGRATNELTVQGRTQRQQDEEALKKLVE